MDVKGKRVLVVGLGKSGIASALFLADKGARVAVSDTKSQEELHHEIPQLLDRGIDVESGYHGERTFKEQELIEAITHLAFYSGWPNAMSAIMVAKELFAKS